MDLEITEVQNPKHNDDKVEKIFFKAKKGANLKDYLLYDDTFTDEDAPSNKGRHIYRFPSFSVEKNCYIVLWIDKNPKRQATPVAITEGEGESAVVTRGYRFYWNRTSPIINNTGDSLTLIKVGDEQPPFKVSAS